MRGVTIKFTISSQNDTSKTAERQCRKAIGPNPQGMAASCYMVNVH
jgi:hypothetical protein